MVGEARRAERALALRKVELREEHVVRLHSERRATYAAFYRSFWKVQKAQRAVAHAMQESMRADPPNWLAMRASMDGLNAAIAHEGGAPVTRP